MEWQENMGSPSNVFGRKNNTVLGRTFKRGSVIIMFIIQLQGKNYLFGNGLLHFVLTVVALIVLFPFLLLFKMLYVDKATRSLGMINKNINKFESLMLNINASLNIKPLKGRPGNSMAWEGFHHV